MKQTPKMVSVELPSGAWYVEPGDNHVFLHVIQDSLGQLSLIASIAQDLPAAERRIHEGEILGSVMLFDLLSSAQRAKEDESENDGEVLDIDPDDELPA